MASRADGDPGSRYRTAGITLIGLGLALMLLLSFVVGDAGLGIGVGGAWASLGAASLTNYLIISRRAPDADLRFPPRWTAPPPPSREPPENVAP